MSTTPAQELYVVDNPAACGDIPPGATVAAALDYLTDPAFSALRHLRVINLCRDRRYQTLGYYVSLLAEARGHRPQPRAADLVAKNIDAPYPRARVTHAGDTPPRIAILHDPHNPEPPSNAAAMRKFLEAAEALGMRAELVTRADFAHLAGFDALFIRDSTSVDNYSFRISREAANAGLVVIDDPDSIVRCNNKVYLAELFGRYHIPAPKTLLVHRGNVGRIVPELGLPCVLKQPDSSFSLGVLRAGSEKELRDKTDRLLAKSGLIVAQEYLPTEFDWRVGILDRKPLFVAKYFMAPGHWQIIRHGRRKRDFIEGRTEAVPVEAAPRGVLDIALKAADLIGDGFYGVDIKQAGGKLHVIEINDNPNVDAGNEDTLLGDELYRRVMLTFLDRIHRSRQGKSDGHEVTQC